MARFIFEEWDDENLTRKYPLRKNASMELVGPEGSLDLPLDFLLDAVITAPGLLSEFALHSITVTGDTVSAVVQGPVEKMTAIVKMDTDFSPLLGETSSAVYGCLVFGRTALKFRNKRPGIYYSNITNKFVPRILKSAPAGLSSLTVNGQKFYGDIYVTMGKGVSLGSDNQINVTGDKYHFRDKLYNSFRKGDVISLPILSINNTNNNGIYNLEAWNVGDPNTQRIKVQSVAPDTLVVVDAKDV